VGYFRTILTISATASRQFYILATPALSPSLALKYYLPRFSARTRMVALLVAVAESEKSIVCYLLVLEYMSSLCTWPPFSAARLSLAISLPPQGLTFTPLYIQTSAVSRCRGSAHRSTFRVRLDLEPALTSPSCLNNDDGDAKLRRRSIHLQAPNVSCVSAPDDGTPDARAGLPDLVRTR
jgi:hypothetical protein